MKGAGCSSLSSSDACWLGTKPVCMKSWPSLLVYDSMLSVGCHEKARTVPRPSRMLLTISDRSTHVLLLLSPVYHFLRSSVPQTYPLIAACSSEKSTIRRPGKSGDVVRMTTIERSLVSPVSM